MLPKKSMSVVLAEEATWWCAAHGVVLAPADKEERSRGLLAPAPVSLRPFRAPRDAFLAVSSLSPSLNRLMHAVACDHSFLRDTLSGVSSHDDFTGRLLELLPLCSPEDLQLGLLRSDYMLQEGAFKQVEVNTIASSFAGLSQRVGDLHGFLHARGLSPLPSLPTQPLGPMASAMLRAHQWFLERHPQLREEGAQVVVLNVVQPQERNMVDQKALEYRLEELGVRMVRRTLGDLRAELTEQGGHLALCDGEDAGSLVSLVYYRAGYAPTDYPSEKEWSARALLQESTAVQCPSVAYQLAGTKKVQQVLCRRDVLVRFLERSAEWRGEGECTGEGAVEGEADAMLQHFVGMSALEDGSEENREVLRRARDHPEDFVLKPQREGGGNLVFGEQLRAKVAKALQSHEEGSSKAEELGVEFTLMERIRPVTDPEGLMLRAGSVIQEPTVSELGIFSCILADHRQLMVNCEAGYLVRTKVVGTEEGGVAAGASCIDSLSLADP